MGLTYLGRVIKDAPAAASVSDTDLIGIVDPVTGEISNATKDQLGAGGGGGGVFYGDVDDLSASSNRSAFPVDTQGVLVEIDALPGGASVDNIFYFDSPNAGKYLKLIINGPVRAANCGIKAANTASANAAALQAAVDHAGIREIVFDEPGGADIQLTGTVTVPATKVLSFKNGNRITGTCTLSGGIINAHKTQQIFATTVTARPSGSTSGEFSVKWYGAVGDNVTDDTVAIQASIDACVVTQKIGIVRFPYGQYVVSKGLLVRKSSGAGQPSTFTTLSLLGEVYAYDTGSIGAASAIRCAHNDNFCIGVQKGKGLAVENFAINGRNNVNFATYADLISSSAVWVINGCRDNQFSPYAGIVIDPFGDDTVASENRYPGFTDMYTEVSNAGSTDVRIKNCFIRGFVVNVCVSPNGTTQNGELIRIDDCALEWCRSAVSTGNTQTRTVWVRNCRCWQYTECFVDSARYGGGGSPAEVIGTNIAQIKYLTLNLPVGIPYAKFTDSYAETLYAIGGDLFSVTPGTQMWFTNCEFKLMGGEGGSSPMTMLVRANQCSFVNCIVAYYASSLTLSYPIDVRIMSAYDCKLSGIFQDINNNPVLYKNCKVTGYFETQLSNHEYVLPPDIEGGRMIVAPGAKVRNLYHERTYRNGPLITVVEAVDTAITLVNATTISFNVGAGNVNSVLVGDYVLLGGNGGTTYTDTTSTAVGRNFVLGKISNVNTGTNVVTVNNVSMNFVLTNGASYRFKVVAMCPVYKTHLGDITSGSPDITNVVGEGNSETVTIVVGDFIIHPAFAQSPAARVTNVSGSTVTVNKNASFSETEAAICSTDYEGSVISNETDFMALAFNLGCRKGDKIINNYKASADDDIPYWVCTKSGILSSADLPTFKAVTAI